MPIFSSLFFKDFNNFKKLRNDSFFDISIYFTHNNYEEVVCKWFVDSIFFFKILHHCYYNNINFPEMQNLLTHYDFIFSYKKMQTDKKFSSYPIVFGEFENNLMTISNLFSASVYYDTVQKDLVHIYKRDQVLDSTLFNFFFFIEEILKWSPFDAYHKFDETSYITEIEALEMLINNKEFKASNKVYNLLEKAKEANKNIIFSFNESQWDREFYGVYFSEIFFIFIFFFIGDVIAYDSDWFLFRYFLFQKDLEAFTAGDTLGVIFDVYFVNFFDFDSSSFFFNIINNFIEFFFYYLFEIMNPNVADVEYDSRFFFFGLDDTFEDEVLWNVFDWWHDEYYLIEDDEFFHDSAQFLKEDEESPDHRSDLYLENEDSAPIYNNFSDWYSKKFVRVRTKDKDKSWYYLRYNLHRIKWNRHHFFMGAYKSELNNVPFILKALAKIHEEEVFDNYQYDTPIFFEYVDIDWFYLTKIYDVSNWNYQAVLPMSTFYFFFFDYFVDNFNDFALMSSEFSDYLSSLSSYYFNFEYLSYLVKYYFKGFVIYDLFVNINDHPWYFTKVIFWYLISYLVKANNFGNGDLFTYFFC